MDVLPPVKLFQQVTRVPLQWVCGTLSVIAAGIMGGVLLSAAAISATSAWTASWATEAATCAKEKLEVLAAALLQASALLARCTAVLAKWALMVVLCAEVMGCMCVAQQMSSSLRQHMTHKEKLIRSRKEVRAAI